MLLFNTQKNVGFHLTFGHSLCFLKNTLGYIFKDRLCHQLLTPESLLKDLKNLLKSEILYVNILVDREKG